MNTREQGRARRLGLILSLIAGVATACSSGGKPTVAASKPTATVSPSTSLPALPGGRIVFRRYKDLTDSQAAIFTARPDGSDAKQITRFLDKTIDSSPRWSFDGSRVTFDRETTVPCSNGDGATSEIWLVRADGTGLKQLTQSPAGAGCDNSGHTSVNSTAGWSPDDSLIVWNHAAGPVTNGTIENSGLWSMNADGTNQRQITQRKRPSSAEDGEPFWDPNSNRIVFRRSNSTAEPTNKSSLFTMKPDGSDQRRITPWELNAGSSTWSPDGTHIVFRSNADVELGNMGEVSDLYTVRPDGTGLTNLTHATNGGKYFGSTWSPDGKWIVVGRAPRVDGTNRPALYLLSADGTQQFLITRTELWEGSPDWSRSR